MIKAIVIGDCHFKTTNAIQTELMVAKILETCNLYQPDFIVMLGDTLDRHETIHVDPLSRANQFLYQLTKIAPTYLLIGNHDRPNNSDFLSDKHPFTGLKWLDNLYIVDKVLHQQIKQSHFTFVPYVPPGRFKEALSTIPHDFNFNQCIFAHQEFKNAKMGAIVSVDGDEWESTLPLVVSGHVHDFDELQNNLIYTGTPIQHSFGDKEDKTISYFEFSGDQFHHQRIDLKLPKKRLLHYNYQDFIKCKSEDFDDKNETKIIIKGLNAELKLAMKSLLVKELERRGIKISYKEVSDHLNSEVKAEVSCGYHEKLMLAVAGDQQLSQLVYSMFGPLKLKL